jgi:hypothetical protein
VARSVAIVMDYDQMVDKNNEQYSRGSPLSKKRKLAKHTMKYLACCTDPDAYIAVTRAAPIGVIHGICNAALIVQQGDVDLSPNQKALFGAHRNDIATLTSPNVSLARKRKVIQSQTGGFFFIPALIGAALGAIGSNIVGSLVGNQQQQQH